MSKYDITYACGHDGRIDIAGPYKNREYLAERESRKLCPECYSAKLAADRAAASAAAAEQAKATGLPALTGSAKQIAWAETIRAKAVAELKILTAYLDALERKPALTDGNRLAIRLGREAIATALSRTYAHEWIDSRHNRYERDWLKSQIKSLHSEMAA